MGQKWVKKRVFQTPGSFGMLEQMFLTHFEPNLTQFSPFRHMYAPSCTLHTYLRAVWWSHLELGRGVWIRGYMCIYIHIHISLRQQPNNQIRRQWPENRKP